MRSRIDELASGGIIPKLAAVLVGDDPASHIYVRNKGQAFEKQNCQSQTYRLSKDVNELE